MKYVGRLKKVRTGLYLYQSSCTCSLFLDCSFLFVAPPRNPKKGQNNNNRFHLSINL